jgi:eukaryotic-like serine/threonine-protein kinase
MTRRALSEARLAAQLAHPAICRVLDFGLSRNGDPFVVSELMQGEELDQVLRRERRLNPRLAVRTVLPILDGLAAAHGKGIVHRDVKPANMFLARDAEQRVQPKLLDFGIARVVNTKLRITEPGMVCGTAYYMSPEQARGSGDLDARSDLWSFCASLYELVSGSPPFEGGNDNEVLAAVLTTEPRPLVEWFVVDAALSAIVMRGLARDPSQRFASAQELGRQLAQWLLDQGEEHDICGHSLRDRLTTFIDRSASHHLATPASSSRRRLATPRALSTPVAAERRPGAIGSSARRIGLVSVVLGGLLGALALAVHPVFELPRGRGSAPRPRELETATSELAVSAARVNVTTAVVPTTAHPGLGGPNPRPIAQSPVQSERKPVLGISPIVPKADGDGHESKREKQQPVSTTLSKKNELGYDFGF